MKVLRKIIEIDEEKCDGCGQCVIACAEGAIAIVDGKAKLVSESYCDGLGACIGECPQNAITIVEREAEDFDPEAVEKHLEELKTREATCPSVSARFSESRDQLLRNWPVKLKLVPSKAPFLRNANLLIAADCSPAASPRIYESFMPDRVVLIGCPKFDNLQEYLEKLSGIFLNSDIKGVTVLRMQVPCCSGLTGLVRKALEVTSRDIKAEEVVISPDGQIIQRKPIEVAKAAKTVAR
ncbi:ATP-binding protein [Thermodesulforhabdus norvegica]|uniref:4Fe-4S binding domain-containing protein n=1 Tax=Thermodesulforhabdus norvegica TaxID=39841 RepID=A0A1I4W3H8_9BACT|nr:4Fe-4S binding protein [Thermodesulforhabdus norvegica]SFN07806.1 4Fe-4S binding domain-containing protein [Thermodesulforhabdus norvegica]